MALQRLLELAASAANHGHRKEYLMSRENVEQLLDRWINEPAFRDEIRADPEGAIERAGVTLDEEEQAALLNIDWSLPDEELAARVSKLC
jgi:hypothetical protein